MIIFIYNCVYIYIYIYASIEVPMVDFYSIQPLASSFLDDHSPKAPTYIYIYICIYYIYIYIFIYREREMYTYMPSPTTCDIAALSSLWETYSM